MVQNFQNHVFLGAKIEKFDDAIFSCFAVHSGENANFRRILKIISNTQFAQKNIFVPTYHLFHFFFLTLLTSFKKFFWIILFFFYKIPEFY